jgi:hypothetical protein
VIEHTVSVDWNNHPNHRLGYGYAQLDEIVMAVDHEDREIRDLHRVVAIIPPFSGHGHSNRHPLLVLAQVPL